jgi:hypothetical protein
MKKFISLSSIVLSAMLLFSGCIVIGNRGAMSGGGTIGQQLLDLKTAEAHGAITDAEYQTLRAKALGNK